MLHKVYFIRYCRLCIEASAVSVFCKNKRHCRLTVEEFFLREDAMPPVSGPSRFSINKVIQYFLRLGCLEKKMLSVASHDNHFLNSLYTKEVGFEVNENASVLCKPRRAT